MKIEQLGLKELKPYERNAKKHDERQIKNVMESIKQFGFAQPYVFNGNMNAYVFCNKDLLPQYLNWAVENKYSYNVLVWKKPNAIPIGDSHRPDIEYLLLFRKNALWNNSLKEVNYSRCLEFSRETGLHPTMKPVKLIANELFISSNENSNVVDFFGGSGSTLIACEQTKRNCFMCELSPQYVDVIVKRYINLIGNDKEIYLLREGKKIPYAEFIEM